jgi:hypothetical protein
VQLPARFATENAKKKRWTPSATGKRPRAKEEAGLVAARPW